MFLSPLTPTEKPLEGLWHGFRDLKVGLSCRLWGSGTWAVEREVLSGSSV